jgi:hypothetical protein
MLEEKQDVVIDLARNAPPREVALQLEGEPVGNRSEVAR